MIAIIITCAILSAAILMWTLGPLKSAKAFYGAGFAVAGAALGLYLMIGNPDLPSQPFRASAEAQKDSADLLRIEFALVDTLSRNPDDAEALIRLLALRVLEGRINDETIRMFEHAESLKPGDRRLDFIRASIKAMKSGTL